eukprot:m.22537 g.22537  ORF g.22537 m.22537 type:complete len:717 (-) comp10760_c0_seq2:1166-3316(-)
MDKSGIIRCDIEGYEKRPGTKDVGKHYVYRIRIEYASGKVDRVWRRYSQFDALKQTLSVFLKKDGVDAIDDLKLTPKKFLGRSSVRNVAATRAPRLQAFVDDLISRFSDNAALMTAFAFFVTPTATDVATKATSKESPDSDEEGGSVGTLTHDIPGENDGELSASRGDVVFLSARSLEQAFKRPDGDWAMARSPDGARGLVPLAMIALSEVNGDADADAGKVKTAAAELVQTEKQFLANLIEVRDSFFPRLRHILTAPEAKCLFGNWAELIGCAVSLKAALEDAGGDVVPVLLEELPKLKEPYSKYCQGIPAAQDLYNQKQLDKTFITFEQSFPMLNKPTLNHFMRPVQRIMKYPLLLMEIKKKAAKAVAAGAMDDVELATIVAALDIATELANDANTNMNKPIELMNKQDISGPQHETFSHVKHVEGSGAESPSVPHKKASPSPGRRMTSPFLSGVGRSTAKRSKKQTKTIPPEGPTIRPSDLLASRVLRAGSDYGGAASADTSPAVSPPPKRALVPRSVSLEAPAALSATGEDYLSVSPCAYLSDGGRSCHKISIANARYCENHLCPECEGPKRSVHDVCRTCERDSGAAGREAMSTPESDGPDLATSTASPPPVSTSPLRTAHPPPQTKPPRLSTEMGSTPDTSKPPPPPHTSKPELVSDNKPPPPPNKPKMTAALGKPAPPPNKPTRTPAGRKPPLLPKPQLDPTALSGMQI